MKSKTRKWTLKRKWMLGSVAAVVLFIATNVTQAAFRSTTLGDYWRKRMRESKPADAIHLVALGDSTVEAVGAKRPMEGYVGWIAEYIKSKTNHPVHITNVSQKGDTTEDMINTQLSRVDLKTADIVIAADSNDMQSHVPLAQYRSNLNTLLNALPAERTVFSDLPLFPGRKPYQKVLEQVSDAHNIMRADFASVFRNEGRRLDIFSWLPPHLNSKGYKLWFKAFQPKVDVIIDRIEND